MQKLLRAEKHILHVIFNIVILEKKHTNLKKLLLTLKVEINLNQNCIQKIFLY